MHRATAYSKSLLKGTVERLRKTKLLFVTAGQHDNESDHIALEDTVRAL